MNFKIKSYFAIMRPLNVQLGMVSIFLGAFITGTITPLQKVICACVSGGLVMAGGNVINDYYDVEIDRVNKPYRPLPASRLRAGEALTFARILFALGIFLSIFIQLFSFAIAVIITAGLIVYSAKLKRTILFGNITVSLFSALTFVYGGLAVDRWQWTLIPAGFAFLFHFGREIIKDVEDKAADASGGAQTLAVRFGNKRAFALATAVFGLLIFATFLPYVFEIYGKRYFWTVLLGVDMVLVVALVFMWTRPEPSSLRRISAVLKADMLVGLLAIFLGRSV
jgi:geranylgeranylglycerol-phosphate geranylgeranyltransferase